MRLAHAFLPLAVMAAGCDPQADADYRGERLATFEGVVAQQATADPDQLTVSIRWEQSQPPPFPGTCVLVEPDPMTQASVQGTFPAQFTLEVFWPPPDHALHEREGVRMAEGDIVAIDDFGRLWGTADWTGRRSGGSSRLNIYYLEEPAFGMTAGYHLAYWYRAPDSDPELIEVPADETLRIELHDPVTPSNEICTR